MTDDAIQVVISRDGDGRLAAWHVDARIRMHRWGVGDGAVMRWYCTRALGGFDGSTSTKGCLGSLGVNQKAAFELRRAES